MLWWTLHQFRSLDVQTRILAVEKLAITRHQKATGALVSALRDPEKKVRKRAARAFAFHTNAGSALLQIVNTPEPEHREAVADALMHVGDPRAVAALVELLVDPVFIVRQQAAKSLERLNWEPGSIAERVAYLVAHGQIENLPVGAMEALRPLTLAFCDPSQEKRNLVVAGLGMVGGEEAGALIIGALKDADFLVRIAAVDALENYPALLLRAEVVSLLEDTNELVRVAAVKLWGKSGNESARDLVAAALADSSEQVRRAATKVLARLGDPRALPALREMLSSLDEAVCLEAIECVGDSGLQDGVELLSPFLRQRDEALRKAASEAVQKLALAATPQNLLQHSLTFRQVPSHTEPEQVAVASAERVEASPGSAQHSRDILVVALNDRNLQVRRAAIRVIAEVRGDGLLEALRARRGLERNPLLKSEIERVADTCQLQKAEPVGQINLGPNS